MRLAYVFAVLDSLNLAKVHLTKIMLLKLALLAALVVDGCAAKLIMRNSVAHNSIFLGQALLLTSFADLSNIFLRCEELIVVVRGRSIVDSWLEADLEVCNAHRMRITECSLLSKL